MHHFKSLAFSVVSIVSLLSISQQALSARESRSEMNFLVPYKLSQTIAFDGGASAEIDEDVGVGFGYAYNYSDNLAYRVDVTWNSGTYAASQIIDEGKVGAVGDLESTSVLFGVDYYFATGGVAPYVNFNVGWTFVDSNLSSNPDTDGACWNTPWRGQACKGAKPNYSEKNMVAGFGLGLRLEVARRNFMRIGYYHELIDFDQASHAEGMDSIRFEYGFLY